MYDRIGVLVMIPELIEEKAITIAERMAKKGVVIINVDWMTRYRLG